MKTFLINFFLLPILSFGQGIVINEICSSNYISAEDEFEENGDWIEFYNSAGTDLNMGGMYLTDDISNPTKYLIPANQTSKTKISANDHLMFWFDNEGYKGPRHANFKLSASGEFIALVASDGFTIIDSVTFPALIHDVTYGRTTNGSQSWSYFSIPTPDRNNTGGAGNGIIPKPEFNLDAGFYSSPVQIEISCRDSQAVIYYSLNGNEPSPSKGVLYSGPFTLSTTRSVRARAYKSNSVPGEIATRSYFINRPIDLPVLSVVTDSSNLWDENTGIYCFGVDDYDHFYPYYGANFWKDWKKPAHMELFESSGAEVLSQDLELSLSGNTSRVYAQKSLNLEANGDLGISSIPYQLFPQYPVYNFKAFKVRNGGSDWSSTGIRDAFNHTILEGATDVDHQANRPVILYLNGEYWGVMSMTEKIDEHYIHGHYPSVNKDSIDLLFSNAEVKCGDTVDYTNMISFIANNPLSNLSNYNYIKSQIDIPEFINYFESRIYYASTDWPNKNIYYWRPKNHSMKWRWVMWDTDRSDMLTTNPNHPCNVNHNTLAWATTSSSVADWAQFLLNNLLSSQEFRKQFITQYAHHMNYTFCPLRTDSVLNVFRNRLRNELPAHINKWKHSNDTIDYFTVGYYQNLAQWNTEVDTIKIFFDNRARYIRKYMMQQFGISDTSELSANKIPAQGGIIMVDTFKVPDNHCRLVYFDGYPVTLSAVPNPGYLFAGWTNNAGDTLPVTWIPSGDTSVTAYFIPAPAIQPNIPAANYSASVSNCTDIHLHWDKGNGTSRMVVASSGAAVSSFPLDQHAYFASPVFGNGSDLGADNYVVYTGSADSCIVTGLLSGSTYYFAIIEYNGDSITANYNTTNYLSGQTLLNIMQITVSSLPDTLCSGSVAALNVAGAQSCQWSPSDGLSSTSGIHVTAMPDTSITYHVFATDAQGCSAIDSISLVVNETPHVDLGPDTVLCADGSLFLDAGPAMFSYQWSNGSASQVIHIDSAGIGLNTATISVIITNQAACQAQDDISVTFDICASVENSDGARKNVIFPNPFTSDLFIYTADKGVKVLLMDILGKIVYRTERNTGISSLNPEVPPGTYILSLESGNGRELLRLMKF